MLFQGSSSPAAAPAVDATTMLPGIGGGQCRTHVPIKVTNVQLVSPQLLGLPPAPGPDDSTFTHDVLLKGLTSDFLSFNLITVYIIIIIIIIITVYIITT